MARIKKGVSVVINKLKTDITLDVINESGKINWPVLYCSRENCIYGVRAQKR